MATARELATQEGHLALQRALLHRAAHEREQLLVLERLGQVIEGAELHGGDGGAHGLHRGDEDHLDAVVEGLDALEHLDAVHLGQSDVEQHDVDVVGAHDVQRARAVGHVEHVVILVENQAERLSDALLVVHHQRHGAQHVVAAHAPEHCIRQVAPPGTRRRPRSVDAR